MGLPRLLKKEAILSPAKRWLCSVVTNMRGTPYLISDTDQHYRRSQWMGLSVADGEGALESKVQAGLASTEPGALGGVGRAGPCLLPR